MELVFGGGRVGLMGVMANAALRHGGHVIGVIPKALEIKEVVHENLPDLRVVKNMHERKALLAELADGFIALPGGFGTYEEFCEVLTWSQLGFHRKPFGLLDIEGFYRSLLEFFDHATAEVSSDPSTANSFWWNRMPRDCWPNWNPGNHPPKSNGSGGDHRRRPLDPPAGG